MHRLDILYNRLTPMWDGNILECCRLCIQSGRYLTRTQSGTCRNDFSISICRCLWDIKCIRCCFRCYMLRQDMVHIRYCLSQSWCIHRHICRTKTDVVLTVYSQNHISTVLLYKWLLAGTLYNFGSRRKGETSLLSKAHTVSEISPLPRQGDNL